MMDSHKTPTTEAELRQNIDALIETCRRDKEENEEHHQDIINKAENLMEKLRRDRAELNAKTDALIEKLRQDRVELKTRCDKLIEKMRQDREHLRNLKAEKLQQRSVNG